MYREVSIVNCYKYLWLCLLICSIIGDRVEAQVTIDGTTNTNLETTNNEIRIDNGDRAGNNLFHSFNEFSIPDGGSATFNNAVEIENIFSRVTGGNVSDINGVINANGGANLLLINPAGIVFGENASLNIGGSFTATTADSLLFESGEFSAVNPQAAPLLTINRPIGLDFGENAGNIVNRSTANNIGLQVSNGNISLIGGDLQLEGGSIAAPGGTINLGGLGETGTIGFNNDGSLNFADNVERSNVFLSDNAVVDIVSDGGGLININVNNLELTQGSLIQAGIGEGLGSEDAVGGTIAIDSNSISAADSSLIRSNNNGVGKAGAIDITTDTLNLTSNAAITASTFGMGDAGNISIIAQNITLEQDFTGIYSNVGLTRIAANEQDVAGVVGNGGIINIDTDNLTLLDGARISSNSIAQGNAGTININATGNVLYEGVGTIPVPAFGGGTVISGSFSQVQEDGVGNAGQINITADSLNLINLGAIIADNGGIRGDAGDITLNIANEVFLDRTGLILAPIQEGATGNGGDIIINAGSLEARGGSLIQSEIGGTGDAGNIRINVAQSITLNESIIASQITEGELRNGGDISITSAELNLINNSRIAANTVGTSVSENDISTAGNINIDVAGDINLDNGNIIQSQTLENAVGDAGNITIAAGGSFVSTNGNFVLADTRAIGNGGNISITVGDRLVLEGFSEAGFPSQFVAGLSRPNARGRGGIIEINAGELILDDVAFITSNSVPDSIGEAGSIIIDADRLQVQENSLINTFTGNEDPGGAITINAQNIELIKGGKILAATDNAGNGGNINLNVTKEIAIDNSVEATAPFIEIPESPLLNELQSAPSGIYANATPNSTGDSGSVIIGIVEGQIPQNFSLTNQGQIVVNSDGAGSGGNIFISSQNLQLENNAAISASTVFGRGGEVTLQIADNLLLANNSLISARAFESANGGNLTIDTDLIFASPNQNNDIIANAEQGTGGNIDLTAESILGIQERNSNPPNNTNDLDVSSDLSIDGTVTINDPDVDPTAGIIELPSVPIDADAILAQDLCRVKNENIAGGSSFIVTGRGGLTPTSADSLGNINRVVNWTDEDDVEVSSDGVIAIKRSPDKTPNKSRSVIQSQGFAIAPDGSLWLTANTGNISLQNFSNHPDCQNRS